MNAQDDWWRSKVPADEEVLWFGKPDQRLIPKQGSFLSEQMIMFIALVWILQLFLIKSPWGFLLSLKIPLLTTAIIFANYYYRTHCIYVISSRSARIVYRLWFSTRPRTKCIEITPSLKFKSALHRIKLKPFFSFDYIQDKDAALKALTQAQEASK